VGANLRDRRLDRPTRVVDCTRAQRTQAEAAPLVEAERFEVVVRRNDPDRNIRDERAESRDERAAGPRPPGCGDDRDQLALGRPRVVREETDERPACFRHKPRPVEHVDQLAPARLEATAERHLEECLGSWEVGWPEVPDDWVVEDFGHGATMEWSVPAVNRLPRGCC
jgi:hypothetical protein